MESFRYSYALATSIPLLSALVAVPAVAQEQAAEASSSDGLDDIIVVAQRRAERLQDVPIAISAVSAQSLQESGVTGTEGIANLVPGLLLNRSSASLTPTLRGIGHSTGNFGDESPIATYIDGVYQPANGTNIFEFNNIERVEVLRGPQGTLFGRNATGGVIHIMTRDPSFDPSVEGSIGYSSFDTFDVRAYGTAGLSDNVAVNLAGLYHDQGEGWGRNPYLNNVDIRKDKSKGLRGKLLWNPSDSFTLLLGGNYFKLTSDKGYIALPPGEVAPAPSLGKTSTGFYDGTSTTPQTNNFETTSGFAKATYDLGSFSIVNILSYTDATIYNIGDTSALPDFLNIQRGTGVQRTLSNETQLISGPGSPFQWIAGFYYFHDNLDVSVNVQRTSALIDILAKQRLRSYAPYAQVTVPVGANTNLTGGIRYTADNRRLVAGKQTITAGGVTTTSYDITTRPAGTGQKTQKFTYRLSADHKFGENAMVYASFNTGFKSGQYNMSSPDQPPVLPETLNAYEVGIKSEPANWVRLNVSGFWYDYKNLQVRSVDPFGLQRSLNAASQRSRGIDIETEFRLNRTLTVTASGEYLDAIYVQFPNTPTTDPNYTGPGNRVFAPPLVPVPGGVNDVSGNRMPQAPKFTGHISVRQEIPTAFGDFSISGNLSYRSTFAWDPDNRLKQKGYALLSGTVEWWAPDKDFGVRIWTRNLTNHKYASYAFGGNATGDIFAAGEPRVVGLALLFKH